MAALVASKPFCQILFPKRSIGSHVRRPPGPPGNEIVGYANAKQKFVYPKYLPAAVQLFRFSVRSKVVACVSGLWIQNLFGVLVFGRKLEDAGPPVA